jgi:hypothetical protein
MVATNRVRAQDFIALGQEFSKTSPVFHRLGRLCLLCQWREEGRLGTSWDHGSVMSHVVLSSPMPHVESMT